MEKSPKYKLRLGLFILLGFALFVIAIFWIGRQQNLFNPTFKLTADFGDVSGLQVGNNIRFSGINVGTVDAIQIMNDTTVRVFMQVDKDVQPFIKSDSYAAIGSEGLIGDRVIVISQGSMSATSVRNGDHLMAMDPVDMDQLMATLQVTGENAAVITDQLAEIMYKINNGEGSLSKLLEDKSIANSLEQTMQNLQQGTKGFSDNMEAAKNSFLLRGYFKKKERDKDKRIEEQQIENNEIKRQIDSLKRAADSTKKANRKGIFR